MTPHCRIAFWIAAALFAALTALPSRPSAQETGDAGRALIAVLDLKVVGGTEVEGVAISNALREELLRTGRYKLIDRNQMEQVLEEQALQQVGCTGAACVADVGKVLGVAFIVTGSVTKISGDLFQVSASMIDVATAETLRAESVLHEGSLVNLLRAGMPALAVKLAAVKDAPAAVPVAAAAPAAVAPAPQAAPPPGGLRHVFVQKRSMNVKRKELSAAALGGKIYVIGGAGGLGLLEDSAEAYDPGTDAWADRKRMLTARGKPVWVSAGASLYAIGGYNPLSGATFPSVERYEPEADSWKALKPMPVPLANAAGAEWGGKVFVIGGEAEGKQVNSVHVFDPANEGWGRAVDVPISVARHAAAVLDGRIYVSGGFSGGKPLNSMFVFDPALSTWRQLAPMKAARAHHASAAVAGRVFVFGGEVDQEQMESVEEYDPANNAWTPRTSLPRALSRTSAVAHGGKIYVIGGDDGSFGLSAVSINYAYE